jgi:hypothetical protein
MAAIVVATFHANGLGRSVPRAYVRKLDVLVVKNSPCQVNLVIWDIFLTDCTDRCNILSSVTTELNHVLGLR